MGDDSKSARINYERDVKIDETALDVEWLNQSTLATRYARHAAYTRKLADLADERVKVVRSELIKKVTDDPFGTTGKVSPTAQQIEAYYRNHTDHQAAKQAWIEAVYQANYAEMAYKEISFTRKQALENLVVLHNSQYFAGPTMPRDISAEWKKKQQTQVAVDAGINQALKSRRTT